MSVATEPDEADLPGLNCPICHRSIPEDLMYRHSLWCRQNSTGPLDRCQYNRRHRVVPDELDRHQQCCPVRHLNIRLKPPTGETSLAEAVKKVRILQ